MIWGKTYSQENKPRRKFAWYPVKLENGKWCWLEWLKCTVFCFTGVSGKTYRTRLYNLDPMHGVKQPICPINLYFEGDEDNCRVDLCDFDTETRMCDNGCNKF